MSGRPPLLGLGNRTVGDMDFGIGDDREAHGAERLGGRGGERRATGPHRRGPAPAG